MVRTTSTETLFRILQNAITRKLRSVTQTDAVRQWEQSVRRYGVERLVKRAKTDKAVATTLQAIRKVEQSDGTKLAVLLPQLAAHVGKLHKGNAKYPLALIQAVMLKPMNVQATLEHLHACDKNVLNAEQRFCVTLLEAELLSATGQVSAAFDLLKATLHQQDLPLALQLSGKLRYARLARSRQTREAETALHQAMALIRDAGPTAHHCDLELAECARELAGLHVLCGQHASALQWGQRALAALDRLLATQSGRVDLQLQRAMTLRTLALAQHDMDEGGPSRKLFKEAAEIVARLMAADPEDNHLESELPRSHDVLGDIHLANLDLDKALEEYRASAAIGAHLEFRDPLNVRWQLEAIHSALRIAQVLKKMGHIQDGLDILGLYEPKLEALIEQDPENLEHRASNAQLKSQMGDLYWQQQAHQTAADVFSAALEQIQFVIDRDSHPSRWILLRLMITQRLSEFEFSRGDWEASFRLLNPARDTIVRAMAEGVHTKKLREFFVAITTRLSDFSFDSGKTAEGMQVQESALAFATQYQKEHPNALAWTVLLSGIQTHSASHYLKLGMMDESRTLWERAVASLSLLSAQHEENLEVSDYLIRAQLVQVMWLCKSGAYEEAHAMSRQLLASIRQSQQQLAPGPSRQELLCECLEHYAMACYHLDKKDQELQALQEIEGIRKTLLQAHPDSAALLEQYSRVRMAMGQRALQSSQLQLAIAHLNESLRGFNTLHEQRKEHPAYLLAIGNILISLGHAYELSKNAQAVQTVFNQALLVAGWLGRAGQENYVMRFSAVGILFSVSQSAVYANIKHELLRMAEEHAKHLLTTSQNPAVMALLKEITLQRAMV